MTTNLHDKMLAAIDAYFSASDGTEEEVAENLLLDVRDEINKQKYVPETNFGNMAEPKIGCVGHDCDKCKAVQEPVAQALSRDAVLVNIAGWLRHLADDVTIPYFTNGAFKADCNEAADVLLATPPAPQPVPVKCWCHKCNEHNTINGLPFSMTQMILCPECGNKRCPKASDHQLDCTGSNEPNQPGSVYTAPQPVPVKTYHDGKPWPVAPKPWVGLTDDDIHEQGWNLSADRDYEAWTGREFLVVNGVNDFARAIEAKLKEKNHV